MIARLSRLTCFAGLPTLWPGSFLDSIRSAVAAGASDHKLVVLHDDPTGTQTLRDAPVLTEWSVGALRREFAGDHACFQLLTDIRHLATDEARERVSEICANLRTAAGLRAFTPISCGDSALRSHFPLDTELLEDRLGPFAATFLIPFFADGGRYTIQDVHYVAEGDDLIPVADTSFARDPHFGFCNSNLRRWVEEKTGGRVKAGEVAALSIGDLRQGGPARVLRKVLDLAPGTLCLVNAAAGRDLEVFTVALLAAERQGRRYCFHAAPQFVATRLGMERRPLTTTDLFPAQGVPRLPGGKSTRDHSFPAHAIPPPEPHRTPPAGPTPERDEPSRFTPAPAPIPGGLVIVGSYLSKTTLQLNHLPRRSGLFRIELRVDRLLTSRRCEVIEHTLQVLEMALKAGQDAIVFTSRPILFGDNPAGNRHIGQRVSFALVELVQRLEVRPRYLLAKGSQTASKLATCALGIKRATVLGQLLPCVPVWRLGLETKFPDLLFVVFPGHAGQAAALDAAMRQLTPQPPRH